MQVVEMQISTMMALIPVQVRQPLTKLQAASSTREGASMRPIGGEGGGCVCGECVSEIRAMTDCQFADG